MSGRIALFVLDAALDVGAHQGPLTAGAHERDDVLHQRIVGKIVRDPANSVGKDTIAKKAIGTPCVADASWRARRRDAAGQRH